MQIASKPDIRKESPGKLEEFLLNNGEKPFKVKQIREWLWNKSARSFDEMTNISLQTRDLLKEHYEIRPVRIDLSQYSNDKTIKCSFRLFDDHKIEGVLIPADERMTACISSQVGCSLSCKFCATGYMERKRNLDASEIYDQVVLIRDIAEKEYKAPLSNIVYMGMGEPLLNYNNVLESVDYITSETGLGMSARRITVSTVGIAKMIKKLGDDQVKFNLALSLHAANNEKRSRMMPINDSNSVEALKEALQYYYQKTRNRITYEYIVFYNFNDTLTDANELYEFVKAVPSKVNLIEYNPIDQADFRNTDPLTMEKFAEHLRKKGVNVRIRRSRGKDIDAACGQLANKN